MLMKLENLRLLRKRSKLNQKELATKLGIDQRTISHYELGDTNLPIDVLMKLADFFGVSTDYLLGRKKEKMELSLMSVAQLALLDDVRTLSDEEVAYVRGFIKYSKDMKKMP